MGQLPDLDRADAWLHGGPLTRDSLAGGPVVIAIWSDIDPQALSSLPVLETWHEAYARYGLRVVGLYTPEFVFGADSTVPARVARRLGLTFPIALDPGYRVRGAFEGASAGASLVLADASGRIVHASRFEALGQVDRLLRAELARTRPEVSFPPEPQGGRTSSTPPAPRFVFLGTARAEEGPLTKVAPGRAIAFTTQFRYQEEGKPLVPYPVGRWVPSAEGLASAQGGAAHFVAIRIPEGDVSLVAGPAPEGSSRVWLLAGDNWLDPATRGADVRVDARGATYIDVAEPRLYSIARGAHGIVLRASPESKGLTIYAFVITPAGRRRL